MRYAIIHKTNAEWESGRARVTPEIIRYVGEMMTELERSGVLRDGDGLGPSSEGARVRIAGATHSAVRGPFGGAGAIPARALMFRAPSLDDAVEIAARFGRIFGDVVVDVRHANEAWDLGLAPVPEGLTPRRYMAVVNADAASEAGTPLTGAQRASLRALEDELSRAGAFLSIAHYEPTARGKRLHRVPAGRPHDPPRAARPARRLIDGPFVETKELIGGFVVVEVSTIEEAIRWARVYGDAVDVEEIEVRGLVEHA